MTQALHRTVCTMQFLEDRLVADKVSLADREALENREALAEMRKENAALQRACKYGKVLKSATHRSIDSCCTVKLSTSVSSKPLL
jgi:hypothetical protein